MPIVPPGSDDALAIGAGVIGGIAGLFSEEGYVFDPFRYDKITIGTQVLPFQPLVSYRQRRNMVITKIAGSGQNYDLGGSTVKEDMGLSEATLRIDGVLMSYDKTLTQKIAESLGQSGGSYGFETTWVNQLTELRLLFEEEFSLPISDESEKFEALGIERVVLRSLQINDIAGTGRRSYRLELIQDRPVEIERLLPIEEVE